jgi:pimeloyl-ACP methyl ester carboxylesterase
VDSNQRLRRAQTRRLIRNRQHAAVDRQLRRKLDRTRRHAQPRLGCPEFDTLRADTFPVGPSPDQYRDAIRACRSRLLAGGIDLNNYNAAEDASDLNDLRHALGYDEWNVYALSTGRPIGLTAMRLHPNGIRSVVFDSPASNLWEVRGPDIWRPLKRALEKVFSGCAANAACSAAYPNLRARFFARIHLLRRDPVIVDSPVEGDGTVPLTVDGDMLLDAVAGCAGERFCAPSLPGVLHSLAGGNVGRVLRRRCHQPR